MTKQSPVLDTNPVLSEITGETSFAYLVRARELVQKGVKVVSFGIGQPDFPTPEHIREAAKEALSKGFTGYTETKGILELREAIAEHLGQRYGVDIDPEEILVTTGAKTALFIVIATYIREGDEAIIIEPSYYSYSQSVKFLGGKNIFVPLAWHGADKGFKLDVEEIEEALSPKTRLIVLNNPHNPTGAVFSRSEIEALLDIVKKKKILLVADEVYDYFVYDGGFYSALQDSEWKDYVVYVNSFSKTFSMTGWRLGYVVARRDAIDKMTTLAVTLYSCATSFAQKAGVTALRGNWTPVKKMIEVFKKRRDLLYDLLSKIPGIEVWRPKGAFYMFPSIKQLLGRSGIKTSSDFVDYLIDNYGVITLPGTSFPDKAGEGFIRLSYATSEEAIIEGVKRIREAVEKIL